MAAPFAQTNFDAVVLSAAPGPFESASQEDLFQDLSRAVKADRGVLSRVVCTRPKRDQREIARILGHLPLVREAREGRRSPASGPTGHPPGAEDAEGAAARPRTGAEAPAAAPEGACGPPRQQSAGARGRQREGAQPPRSARVHSARSGASYRVPRVPSAEPTMAATAGKQASRERAAAARRAMSSRMARKETGQAAQQVAAWAPGSRGATPLPAAEDGSEERPGASAGLPGGGAAAEAPHAAAPAAPQDRRPVSAELRARGASKASGPAAPAPAGPAPASEPDRPRSALAGRMPWTDAHKGSLSSMPWAAGATAPALLPGGARPDPAFLTAAFRRRKAMEDDAGSQAKTDLASLGIVAEKETPENILYKMYMRTGGTTYATMTKEAKGRLQSARSPIALAEVMKSEALEEVKLAQQAPKAKEGDHLDRWEMDTLADVCRAIKHYDEVARGPITESMRHYSNRSYREEFGRKAFVRNPPWAFG